MPTTSVLIPESSTLQSQSSELKNEMNHLHTLRGSFSAVSKPIFACKTSLESSWRDLQDLHTFAPLKISAKMRPTCLLFQKVVFHENHFQNNFAILNREEYTNVMLNIDETLSDFFQIFQIIPKMSNCPLLMNSVIMGILLSSFIPYFTLKYKYECVSIYAACSYGK